MKFDVIVVGGGLSGLMAARVLSTNSLGGLKICILEARDRVGGRTETLDNHIDVGAQWIGPTHSVLLGLVKHFNLSLEDQFYPHLKGPRNGAGPPCGPVPGPAGLTECVGFVQSPLIDDDIKQINSYLNLISELSYELNINCPWTHPKANEWDNISIRSHVSVSISSKIAQDEVLLFVQTVLACLSENTSFLFFLFYIASSGGIETLMDGNNGAQKWKLIGGMKSLTESLCAEIEANGVSICVSSIVKSVSSGGSGALQKILLASGDIFSCHRIIFALSPQLIGKIKFNPELPIYRWFLENSLISGHAIKVIVVYNRAFWLDHRSPCRHRTVVDIGPVHNLFHSKCDGRPALVGLITGLAALQMENFTKEQRRLAVISQIKEMYGVTEEPEAYYERVWSHEEFSGGCFAGIYPPDGTLCRLGPYIREPIGHYHWASTETATEFYGYMEGALRSGQRAALEVLLYPLGSYKICYPQSS
jgi:monoamine oxidase